MRNQKLKEEKEAQTKGKKGAPACARGASRCSRLPRGRSRPARSAAAPPHLSTPPHRPRPFLPPAATKGKPALKAGNLEGGDLEDAAYANAALDSVDDDLDFM